MKPSKSFARCDNGQVPQLTFSTNYKRASDKKEQERLSQCDSSIGGARLRIDLAERLKTPKHENKFETTSNTNRIAMGETSVCQGILERDC